MAILTEFLRSPDTAKRFALKDWELLIRQSRSSNLLGRLGYLIQLHSLTEYVPKQALRHIQAFEVNAAQLVRQSRQEMHEINQALGKQVSSIIVLKGAAYVALNLPNHRGRSFSDIDILVPHDELAVAEQGLVFHGWQRSEMDDYDDMYYRKWMHEIPPLQHIRRGSVIDLHHNILPPTNAQVPDSKAFKLQSVYVETVGEVTVLDDLDLVIHSATHLFTESEFHNGLRDLSDLDLLFLHFAQNPNSPALDNQGNFYDRLISRGYELGLAHYVFLALLFCSLILNTPVPNSAVQKTANYFRHPIRLWLLKFCFRNAFLPRHRSTRSISRTLATFMLYMRGHYLRMPFRLLIPHLFHKAFISPFNRKGQK